MLTPEQVEEARKKYNITPVSQSTQTNSTSTSTKTRSQDFQESLRNARLKQTNNGMGGVKITKDSESSNVLSNKKIKLNDKTDAENILDITGGDKIAKGLGQGLAQGKTNKNLDTAQNDAIEIQGNILQRIKEKKARGEDTSHLENILRVMDFDSTVDGLSREKTLNPENITDKEVLGDALQLGTTAAGGKVAGAIAGKATAATGIAKGALQGAGVGAASGGALGALTGVSQGLENNHDVSDLDADALEGGVIGAIGGAALGGLSGGISGGVKKAAQKAATQHLDSITPKVDNLTPTQYEDLLNKGKIRPKTATKPASYILSDEEIATAEKYKHLLNSKDPVANFSNVGSEIKAQDEKVGQFLRENNGLFNDDDLRNSVLKKMEGLDDITVPTERLQKGKEQIVDNFIDSLEGNDYETLWQARKEFDGKIDKAFSGSPTLQNNMKREFRNAIQDFIAERTPNTTYKDAMKEMSKLFKLKDIISQKAGAERKLSGIRLWAKENEDTLKVLGGIGAAGGLIGLGSSVAHAVGNND